VWQFAHRREVRGIRRIGRLGRVVDEQHDPAPRILLQRGRQQGAAYDRNLFLVRRYEDGKRRGLAGVHGLELLAVGRNVFPAPLQLADAANELHKIAVDNNRYDERKHDLDRNAHLVAGARVFDADHTDIGVRHRHRQHGEDQQQARENDFAIEIHGYLEVATCESCVRCFRTRRPMRDAELAHLRLRDGRLGKPAHRDGDA